ncbi:MAG: hypothetical protein KAX86_04130 [Anaerolineales bacterium]|nr:hypothetical protein [Anaerolineales bacterium]
MCIACQQGLEMPVALPIAATLFTPTDLDAFGRSSRYNDSDDDSGDMFSDLS